MKFTEERLERAVVELLGAQGYPHVPGGALARELEDVLLRDDLHAWLDRRYRADGITSSEIDSMIRALEALPASDLYDSNRAAMKWVSDGYPLKREDRARKGLHLDLIDADEPEANVFRLVTQMEIVGTEMRIPDAILYLDGLPLVVFELKSAVRPEATLHDALCVISDGVNSRMGSLFADYEFFYAWRKVTRRVSG